MTPQDPMGEASLMTRIPDDDAMSRVAFSGAERMGASATPRAVGHDLYYLRGLDSGVGLLRYRRR